MSELPHGGSNPLSTYAYITFQLPPPPPSQLPNVANNSDMGPTRSADKSTRRQQASRRGRAQPSLPSSPPGSPRVNTQLPTGYPLTSLIPRPGIADELPRPAKKSHAKRQPVGHVPRPRNAFILFRCDFVAAKLIPSNVENDHRNISRIAGAVWKKLDVVQRSPWTTRAIDEKRVHKARYPDYRYNPAPSDGTSPSATNTRDMAGHSISQAGSPYGEYTISSSDLSASPPEDHEVPHLRIPGQRSFSAPPDSTVLETELRMPQPSTFPLPVGFFPQPSFEAATNVVVPHASAPIHPGSAAPAYAQSNVSTMPGARSDVYGTVPLTPYAYDWRYPSTDDPDLRRYHDIMQQNSLYDPVESERKPTAEELAAAVYERAAPPEEFVDPHMYSSAYEYGEEPFLGSLDHDPYHNHSDVHHEPPHTDAAWHDIAYTPYTSETSGYLENAHSAYEAHLPGLYALVDRAPGQDSTFRDANTPVTGTVASWAPGM